MRGGNGGDGRGQIGWNRPRVRAHRLTTASSSISTPLHSPSPIPARRASPRRPGAPRPISYPLSKPLTFFPPSFPSNSVNLREPGWLHHPSLHRRRRVGRHRRGWRLPAVRLRGPLLYECHSLKGVEPGSKIAFERVLATKAGEAPTFGEPYVAGARVEATVLENFKDKKLIVFKYRRKKHYKRKNGHRQPMTRFLVTKVVKP